MQSRPASAGPFEYNNGDSVTPCIGTAVIFAAAEPSSTALIVGLVAIPLLILINAFFVAAEFALVALRRSRVEELVNQGHP